MDLAPFILVVDDEKAMARTLADILLFNGYRVEVAHSFEEAIPKLDRASLMLSDIQMPGKDGFELCRAAKSRYPGMPVMLMTAWTAWGIVERGRECGAVAVLAKPLDIHRLLADLGMLLHDWRQEDQSRRPLALSPGACQAVWA